MGLDRSESRFIRYYLTVNHNLEHHYGGRCFTFKVEKDLAYNRMMPMGASKLIASSDFVIVCDDNEVRYLKNRYENHLTAKVDPEEFAWIKLSSVELEIS